MKYEVTQYYYKTVEIEADSPSEAYEKACLTYAFDDVDEVPADEHEVEPIDED